MSGIKHIQLTTTALSYSKNKLVPLYRANEDDWLRNFQRMNTECLKSVQFKYTCIVMFKKCFSAKIQPQKS